ncbi:hypothetical protein BAG01nite_04420 [Brevibacillus agri]|uniref:Uncharacterized protein n=1 Tax=Brevibacillus agri TaxID=51101 RepID=A0A3M8AZJ5_9BACL|nr:MULTISPECIES: hypothetical protein [Brevibacillus]ELK39407.1 hypothetical protein D478_24578 [Brevibacillus agri BAB-2500]EJL46115.1 hypothetical protein PMI08_01292 [Brevibacillus sp. CF112]MBG9565171.1 hypothetical protein [Brevibacillus agri]MBY0053997.1 hypothetical protein [Brevibacillus agri]MCG5251450.1 hypothetical protein [Brevibacillus agri]
MTEPMPSGEAREQELVRQYILFGILFHAVMADAGQMGVVPLKLSYQDVFQELSRWAERKHQQLRRHLRQLGCTIVSARREDYAYVVHYRQRGYLREASYIIEVLRAECQELVGAWVRDHHQGEKRA